MLDYSLKIAVLAEKELKKKLINLQREDGLITFSETLYKSATGKKLFNCSQSVSLSDASY